MILLSALSRLIRLPRTIFAFRHAAVFLALVLAASCAMGQQLATPSMPPPSATANPDAPQAATRTVSDSYVLHNNDLIRLTVFQEDDMTTEARISKSGYLTLPLLGPVELAGKSLAAATSEIRARLDKDYIINPQVTLAVLAYAQQWVTVLGEVQKPGQVEIPPEGGLDLLGAIALAGGYTRVADPGNVLVRREINGKDVVARVDAKRLARDTNVEEFMVQPGDRISVGESIW
jgi:protein involved in polysaccharide export with SLBB domain